MSSNTCRRRTLTILCFIALLVLPLILTVNSDAADGAADGKKSPQAPFGITAPDHSIAESLASEKALLKDIETEYNQLKQRSSALDAELENYQFQHTTYANLAALSQTPARHLENAGFQVNISLINIQDRLDELQEKLDWVKQARADTEEQLIINKQYLAELSASKKADAKNGDITEAVTTLVDVIQQKKTYLGYLSDTYAARVEQFKAIHRKLKDLSKRLNERFGEIQQRAILQQTGMPLAGGWEDVKQDMDRIPGELDALLTLDYFRLQANLFWRSSKSFLLTLAPLLGLLVVIVIRFYPYRRKFAESGLLDHCPAAQLVLSVFRRSIYPLLLMIILTAYTRSGNLYASSPLVDFVLSLLVLYLFTRWWGDAVFLAKDRELVQLPASLERRLTYLLTLVRVFGAVYIFVGFLLEADSELLSMIRLLFELVVIGWCLSFWERNKRFQRDNGTPGMPVIRLLPSTVLFWIIGVGGFVCEVMGYGFFAVHWYVSWGKTLVLGLWAVMGYAALREMGRIYQIDPSADDAATETPQNTDAPVRWLMIKIGQVVLVAGAVVGAILAWGGKRAFLVTLLQALRHPIKVGSLQLSVMGFVYALLVLMLTHLLTQAWRYVFQRKVLTRSGMEEGLQESLTTISAYVIWGLGVLVALHVIGFNTTSLAVAFGALGIGLGFGLQNIFNNFISGIILLFERPIQVGDDIEVDGTWATVKKINVRSTVVQTYDNASLIIPNSELISKQVTNWSFKDKRLRRSIDVGVAYGSNTELVRETLLEVAANTPRVLKYPKPDVVFKDFGDSALVFRLRIWTNVAYFYAVETSIRFEIDRLFRERGIVIAFPQRDVHIYHDQNEPDEE